MGPGVVLEAPELVLVDGADHPGGEQTVRDPVEATLVEDRIESHWAPSMVCSTVNVVWIPDPVSTSLCPGTGS